jgi:TatD DNase family protein
MLHCRDSYDDVLDILERYHKDAGNTLRGNAHFFAGNIDQAKRFLDLGFTMSFTGVITFTSDYDEVISYVPLDSIHAETDSPFVAPVPYRGTRNNPAYVTEVVSRMAIIKHMEEESLCKALISNASRLFGVSL